MDFDTHPDNFTTDAQPTPAATDAQPNPSATAEPAVISFGNDSPTTPKPKHRRRRKLLWWTLAIVAVVLAVAMWIRYLNPYGVGAQECGYVSSLECRGYIFKTWEGQMIVKSALTDTTGIYTRSFDFSVENADVANELLRLKNSGNEVVVTYKRYFGTLPWRGEQRYVVSAAEPAPLPEPTEPLLPAEAAPADSLAVL